MVDFLSQISNVKLDKEFEPLEELLKDSKIEYLRQYRTEK